MPHKKFGQHFLKSTPIIKQIIEAINPQPGDCLLEIGPGLGALTIPLLQLVPKLNAIEIDADLIAKLRQQYSSNLNILHADVLKVDLSQFQVDHQLLRVVGNLPYNISTPLIFKLLSQIDLILDMYFMLQKEVAYRLAATPKNKDYGRLSIMAQYFCKIEKLFDVPSEAFYPRPKVESAVIRMTPRQPAVIAKNLDNLTKIVRLAFNKRRKFITNSLRGVISRQIFEKLNINPNSRPEELTVEDFVKLSNTLG